MLATSIAEPEVETYIADQIAVGNRETLLNQLGLNREELQDFCLSLQTSNANSIRLN